MRRHCPFVYALLGLAACAGHGAAGGINLSETTSQPWLLDNRGATMVTEGGRSFLRLDERAGGGMSWNPKLEFTDGDIEVDFRGRDVAQKSFIGVAFHIASPDEFDAVWLRPFNFRVADSTRHAHGIQFASYPKYSWQFLRENHPGGFESSVPSDLEPDGWNHLHVMVRGNQVTVFLNHAKQPILSVQNPAQRSTGGVGLWVGDNSPGDFANFKVRIHR